MLPWSRMIFPNALRGSCMSTRRKPICKTKDSGSMLFDWPGLALRSHYMRLAWAVLLRMLPWERESRFSSRGWMDRLMNGIVDGCIYLNIQDIPLAKIFLHIETYKVFSFK